MQGRPRQIRYRIYSDDEAVPMIGDYLMSERGRGGYLILGVRNAGRRGGLGEPVYSLCHLSVERVSRAECEANGERLWSIKWDSRKRRQPKTLADFGAAA